MGVVQRSLWPEISARALLGFGVALLNVPVVIQLSSPLAPVLTV